MEASLANNDKALISEWEFNKHKEKQLHTFSTIECMPKLQSTIIMKDILFHSIITSIIFKYPKIDNFNTKPLAESQLPYCLPNLQQKFIQQATQKSKYSTFRRRTDGLRIRTRRIHVGIRFQIIHNLLR